MHKNIALNLKDERIIAPPKIRHNDFITYIHNNTPHTLKYFNKEKYQWDFAVVRQGFYDYNEKITNANLLIKNRQYFFIKAHSKEALMIIHKIDFNKLAHKNTQVLGFSTYDFVEGRILQIKGNACLKKCSKKLPIKESFLQVLAQGSSLKTNLGMN